MYTLSHSSINTYTYEYYKYIEITFREYYVLYLYARRIKIQFMIRQAYNVH